MKTGRPTNAAADARRSADDEFRARMVRRSYERPMDSLGERAFRDLVRNQAAALGALSKANLVLVHGTYLHRHGVECQIAALTRAAELASVYPEALRQQSASADERLRAAETERLAAIRAVRDAAEAEAAWAESMVPSLEHTERRA